MTIWKYIGCEIKYIPEKVKNRDLEESEIKEILETIPLVEGQIEAYNVDSVVRLLIDDNIFPLKIHIVTKKDRLEEKLKILKKLVKNNIPPN
jgi:hypothetical protein